MALWYQKNGQEIIDECEADRFSDFARRKMENGCDLYIHYSNVFYEIELEEMFSKKISQHDDKFWLPSPNWN